MAHAPKGQHWRDMGPARSIQHRGDGSTRAILKSLGKPREPNPVAAHAGVASVGVPGASPTMPKASGGNAAANARFNQATKGPRERPNTVMVSGR